MKRIASLSLAITLGLASVSAVAAPSGLDCSGNAIEVIVAGNAVPVSCLGYFDGNLNGNSTSWLDVKSALTPWSVNLTGEASTSNMLGNLSGVPSFNFGKQLYGETIIGVHYGVIKVGTGKDGFNYTDQTAFYKFDAGSTGVFSIVNNIASISNATLYRSGMAAPVPEPESYAMLLAGLGLVGWVARRRKQA